MSEGVYSIPRFDHLLVTHHRSRADLRRRERLTPIALQPLSEPDALRALRRLVEEKVRKLTAIWLPINHDGMDVVKAISDPFVVGLVRDLWLTEVRLARIPDSEGQEGETLWVHSSEEATRWVHCNSGKLPELWQGPADGVIPEALPFTIRSRSVPPSLYEVEAMLEAPTR